MSTNADAYLRHRVPLRQPPGGLQLILWGLAAVVLCVGAGLAAVKVGNSADTAGFYLLGFVAAGVAAVAALMRTRNPRVTAVLALLVLFPYIARYVPPGRLALSSFDVIVALVAFATFFRNIWQDDDKRFKWFPAPSLWVIQLLLLPSVFFSQFPATSAAAFAENFLIYAFFLFLIESLRQPGGFERLMRFLSAATVVITIGIAIEYVTHFNLSFAPKNLNALHPGVTGRFSGFFSDPQTAGDFLACYVALAATLLFRGRVHSENRWWVVAGLIFGVAGLIGTGSRTALGSALLAIVLVLFLLNKWPPAIKLALGIVAVALVAGVYSFGHEVAALVLPEKVIRRFMSSGDDFRFRMAIWQSTWSIFEDYPWFGIGYSSFRPYLDATRPVTSAPGVYATVWSVITHPESGYLKCLYEAGIVGCSALVLFVVVTIQRAVRVLRWGVPDAKTDVLAALASLAVFFITFFTVFMLPDERNLIVVLLPFAMIWWRSFELPAEPGRARRRSYA